MAILSISFKKECILVLAVFFAFSNHKNRNNSVVARYLSQLVKRTFWLRRRYSRLEKQKKKVFFFCFSLTYSYLCRKF